MTTGAKDSAQLFPHKSIPIIYFSPTVFDRTPALCLIECLCSEQYFASDILTGVGRNGTIHSAKRPGDTTVNDIYHFFLRISL
jgi:hypothetical protein